MYAYQAYQGDVILFDWSNPKCFETQIAVKLMNRFSSNFVYVCAIQFTGIRLII